MFSVICHWEFVSDLPSFLTILGEIESSVSQTLTCKQVPGNLLINTSSDAFSLGVGLRFCISNSLPGQLSASGPQIRV